MPVPMRLDKGRVRRLRRAIHGKTQAGDLPPTTVRFLVELLQLHQIDILFVCPRITHINLLIIV